MLPVSLQIWSSRGPQQLEILNGYLASLVACYLDLDISRQINAKIVDGRQWPRDNRNRLDDASQSYGRDPLLLHHTAGSGGNGSLLPSIDAVSPVEGFPAPQGIEHGAASGAFPACIGDEE
ncbi:hypothetical protein D3C75_605210 [compost metagenome]